jgi:hypothetical protein
MLWVGSVVLGVASVKDAARFRCAALGYAPREEPDDFWAVLQSKQGSGVQVALAKSKTPVQSHPRIHLDLYASDPVAEVERLIGLGARRVEWDSYPPDADFIVLADPDGNIFDVIDKSAG